MPELTEIQLPDTSPQVGAPVQQMPQPDQFAMQQPAQLPQEYEGLMLYMSSNNIADDERIELDEQELVRIGKMVCEGVEIDEESCEEWLDGIRQGQKLANLENEGKSFPWPGASNIKFPLITNACTQFASRAYPEIVQGDKVVKVGTFGEDPTGAKEARAERLTEFMTWQILVQMEDWDTGMDKMLHALPHMGQLLRKTWFDEVDGRPEVVTLFPDDFVVNSNIKSIDTARRVTHKLYLYENDIWERVNGKPSWRDIDYGDADSQPSNDEDNDGSAKSGDDASMHLFYECHCWVDLDDDGYEEPYVVTVHEKTQQVVRIVARYGPDDIRIDEESGQLVKIKAKKYFTEFSFIPSLDGSFHGIGFDHLLYNLNESINTILNQLVDSGTLSNTQGGFKSKEAKVSGDLSISPGEWRDVDVDAANLSKAFFALPFKEPSQVLFALLGMLIETGQSISMIVDVITDKMAAPNASPTSVLAMIEQGMKVYNAIHKRIYRSLKKEINHLAQLDKQYISEALYKYVLDDPEMAQNEVMAQQQGMPFTPKDNDFDLSDFDIAPVCDPAMSTDVQRMARATALMQYANDPAFNGYEIRREFLDVMKIPDADKFIINPADMPPPPPNPLMLDVQRQTIRDRSEMFIKMLEGKADSIETMSKALKNIAEAEAAEVGTQMDVYRATLEGLISKEQKEFEDLIKQGGMAGPEAGPTLQEVPGIPAAGIGGMETPTD